MPDVERYANRLLHLAGVVAGLPLHLASGMLQSNTPPTPEGIRLLRRRRMDLVDADLDAARRGTYPRRLVYDRHALRDPVAWPLAIRDFFAVRGRRSANSWRLDPTIGADFPAYYRRRFHWQKDGYLSPRSARRYDLGVELLFLGAADTMRRQVIPPLVERLPHGARVLDVACGTGRTLAMLAAARPDLELIGVDLSPHYIAHARRQLRHPRLSLLVANGESLPLPDAHVDAITSTYLFHELPRPVRRRVAQEMVRVTRPGGRIVIEDAAQRSDSEAIVPLLHAFHQSLHEPFFADHIDDPIEGWLAEVGATVESVAPAYVAKVVTARRPDPTPRP